MKMINYCRILFLLIAAQPHRTKGFILTEEPTFSEFKFLQEPEDVVVVRNKPAMLNCEARLNGPGNGRPVKIKWKRDGEMLNFPDFNDRRRLLSNGTLYFSTVYHTRTNRPDEGIYQCVATSEGIGTLISRTATLKVAASPVFESEPLDTRVFLGQIAAFECRVTATSSLSSGPSTSTSFSADVETRWMKDSHEIVLDHRMKVLPSGMLEISDVALSDHGEYRCKVFNSKDPQSSQMSRSASLAVNLNMGEAKVPRAPAFVSTPRNSKAIGEGGTVTMDCAANGHPKPYVTWLKDGSTIDLNHLDSRFTRLGEGSLQIRNVHVGDEGTYQCRAENSEDSIDSAAILDVLVAPSFVRKPENTIAYEKEDIKLECDVYSRPQATVQWYKNGDLIIESEYFQIIQGTNLKILGSVELDSGIYQCVATNPVGNVQAAAQLKVLKKDDNRDKGENYLTPYMSSHMPKKVLSAVRNQNGKHSTVNHLGEAVFKNTPSAPLNLRAAIVATRFITLSWTMPSNPNGDLSGYSVFYKEVGSDRERVVNSTRGTLEEVNIQSLQPGARYVLRVVAYNEHGAGDSSAPLTVSTQDEVDVPGPVSELTARATSAFSILIKWGHPTYNRVSISKYKLYYRQGDYSSETKSVDINKRQYHLMDLREFTEYTFWVSAFNSNGEGALSEEISARTHSDVPADPPQNVTLEAASSKSIIVRWEPPPSESQNGIITGYKLRWRKKGRGKSEVITTDGSRRLYAISGLKNGKEYQIKISGLTVNGSGPATQWMSQNTFVSDLDESVVPDPPSSLRAKASDKQITIIWTPPRDNQILVRGYTIGWGKGIPDEYTKVVDDKERYFVIESLKPLTEYVISLRAYNNIGDGKPIYESVRTKEEDFSDESAAVPLIPPVGLNAIVLSSSTVVLTWMDSTLPRNQLIPDQRYYIVRYTPVKTLLSQRPRHQYRNSTDLNVMIDDLKPNTEYEFTVKIIKGRRQQSPWSLVVTNRTQEAAPMSPPRDLNIHITNNKHQENDGEVILTWRVPKSPNGKINGYVIQYTTNRKAEDREWFVEAVVGEVTTATITNLEPDTKYYAKISARNNKGYGPYSSVVAFTTSGGLVTGYNAPDSGATRDERTPHHSDVAGGGHEGNNVISPLVLYVIFAVGALVIIAVVVAAVVSLRCRTPDPRIIERSERGNKPYLQPSHPSSVTTDRDQREKLNPPPPDLWIGHDQLELKAMDGDETGETTLSRSSEYRSASSMDRSRNYIIPYSGTESEISFSVSGVNKSRRGARESMSICSASTKLLPNSKPVRIAAINGKPRVQRYLSRESVTSSIANGSASNSSTYIRSQYNLNPPPIGAVNANTSLLSDRLDHHMDISLASPDDLPPPGYDPSLTLTAPSDGPPSTIDPGESSSQVGAGSIVGVSDFRIPSTEVRVPNSIHLNNAMCNTMVGNAVQPPQLPPTYLSSAMSTSSGHSSSNSNSGGSSGNNNQGHHLHNINIHNRRQSSGSHGSHPMKSFCSIGSSTGLPVIAPVAPSLTTNQNIVNSCATMPKSIAVRPQQPSSPFKKPFPVHLKNDNCALSNGTNDGSSDSGNSGSSNCETSHSNSVTEKLNSIQPLQVNNEAAFQSGQLPVIADVRSPDVLHNKSGPCDCLSHPIPPSLSTEELHAEMKNLEGLMKDLNSISNPSALHHHHHHHHK